jgi:uncharacterized protein YjbI with pentapeptide repeats
MARTLVGMEQHCDPRFIVPVIWYPELNDNGDPRALKGKNLGDLTIPAIGLDNRNLKGCVAQDTILNHARLREANLNEIILTGAQMIGACCFGSRIRHANLEGVIACGACFDNANFNETRMSGGNFDGANFQGAKLNPFGMDDATFHGALYDEYTEFGHRWHGDPNALGMLQVASER